jgi:hypothetical protein
MKAIIIEEKRFEDEFKKTSDALELVKLRGEYARGRNIDDPEVLRDMLESLHRKFVYELFTLRDRLVG